MLRRLYLVSLLTVAAASFGLNIEDLVKQNRKREAPKFPAGSVEKFEELQSLACNGDSSAQNQLVKISCDHVRAVYAPLEKSNGLLFSVRKPEKGYDTAEHNYAVNLEEFFEETSDKVRIKKKNFDVKTNAGFSYQIAFPKYRPADEAVEVKSGSGTEWIPLADLQECDRCFVKNALIDDIFESSRAFVVSSEDTRLGEMERRDTLKARSLPGSFVSEASEKICRQIVLENKGLLPLRNLIVEYQSFAEQQLMWWPKDFPEDYRVAGYFYVEELEPGQVKKLEVSLADIVEARTQAITFGAANYSVIVPPDQNSSSEGRMNGIWVKVHRFTPYGERLTREYKSSGVPSAKWECVVPLNADI